VIVADASVTVDMLVDDGVLGERASAALESDPRWVVPEHWLAEIFSAIRGLAIGSRMSDQNAADAIEGMLRLRVRQVRVRELIPRMWQLRASFTGHDAAYVALAESRGLTLVTSDSRLARAAVQYCRVELVA
jgi:predicted nucleic acid-binding protein